MREIEFRGYSKDDDKWHYGSLVQTVKGYFIMSKEDGDLYPVEENSIGEYTGFIDKNSNKIFEGDIVEYDDDDDDTNPFLKDNKLFYVEWWREECNGWQLVKRDVPDEHSDTFDYMFYWLSDYDAKLCKVIDNTYEERLKDDKSYRTNKMTNKKFAKTFMFTDDCSNEIIKCLEEEVELTADEMFEKLGYKFFSEQASHIVYKKDGDFNIRINILYAGRGFEKHCQEGTPAYKKYITFEEDKAIHKKIEELTNGNYN